MSENLIIWAGLALCGALFGLLQGLIALPFAGACSLWIGPVTGAAAVTLLCALAWIAQGVLDR